MNQTIPTKENSIKFNAFLNVIKTLTTTLFPIITYMYVSRIFGTEGYGKIGFSNSIMQYFLLIAMLGITNYATSEAAIVKHDKNKFNVFVTEIMVLNIFAMIISYLLLGIIVYSFDKIQPYRSFIFVYSINILLKVIGMEWLYSAVEDYVYVTIRTIIFQILSLFSVLLFVHTYNDLIIYSIIQVTAVGGANVLNFVHARKYVKFVKIKMQSLKKHIKPVMTIFCMTLFINLFTQIDSTMLGLIKGDNAVGLYSAGDKMSSMVVGVIGAISFVMLPRIAYYNDAGLYDEMYDVIEKIVNVVLLISIPSAVGIFILNEPIIIIFSGEAFKEACHTVAILSMRVLLSPLNGVFVLYTFIPLNKERRSMQVTAIAAITNFCMNLILIQKLSFNGAAIATVFAETVEFVFVVIIAGKILPVRKIFKDVWQYFIASVSIILIGIISNYFVSGYIIKMVVVIVLSVICYFSILLLMKNKYIAYLFGTVVKRK